MESCERWMCTLRVRVRDRWLGEGVWYDLSDDDVIPGDVSHVDRAKVAVYSCPFDASAPETKGTVLIKSANELMQFSKGEEDLIEQVCGGVGAYVSVYGMCRYVGGGGV